MDNKKNPNQDPFEEYQRESDPSKRERSYAVASQNEKF